MQQMRETPVENPSDGKDLRNVSLEGTVRQDVQLLTFTVAGEQYGVEVDRVREVLELPRIVKVPKTLEYVRGIINLRGTVVPVIDLKQKFGMDRTEETIDTAIIVMEVTVKGEAAVLGALTDSVQEVIDLGADSIEPAPKFGTVLENSFIQGMGKRNDEFIIILDIDKVFSVQEICRLNASAEQEE
ncbi:CheW protein [Alkalispirochaeta americana]|uniref:CheW protein n=2 Tax=Alkalispirochaeta americana TaxID=159291 RepID=A0A1N6QVM8_9SPIO|nr:CheW protein [Alkalispirochaeta americana]